MPRYKLVFQEEQNYDSETRPPNTVLTYMDTVHDVSSNSSFAMAAILRAIADELDNSRKVKRDNIRFLNLDSRDDV